MFLALAGLLLVLWLFGVIGFQALGGIVHILLIVAVIALVLHFLRGRGRGTAI